MGEADGWMNCRGVVWNTKLQRMMMVEEEVVEVVTEWWMLD